MDTEKREEKAIQAGTLPIIHRYIYFKKGTCKANFKTD